MHISQVKLHVGLQDLCYQSNADNPNYVKQKAEEGFIK